MPTILYGEARVRWGPRRSTAGSEKQEKRHRKNRSSTRVAVERRRRGAGGFLIVVGDGLANQRFLFDVVGEIGHDLRSASPLPLAAAKFGTRIDDAFGLCQVSVSQDVRFVDLSRHPRQSDPRHSSRVPIHHRPTRPVAPRHEWPRVLHVQPPARRALRH